MSGYETPNVCEKEITMPRGRKRKPLVDVDLKCPHCNAEITLKVYRKRINPADPPDYDWEQDIQLKLPGLKLAEKELQTA